MKKEVVCYCLGVTKESIANAINNGSRTYDDVRMETGASAACGRCSDEVKDVIDELKKK